MEELFCGFPKSLYWKTPLRNICLAGQNINFKSIAYKKNYQKVQNTKSTNNINPKKTPFHKCIL